MIRPRHLLIIGFLLLPSAARGQQITLLEDRYEARAEVILTSIEGDETQTWTEMSQGRVWPNGPAVTAQASGQLTDYLGRVTTGYARVNIYGEHAGGFNAIALTSEGTSLRVGPRQMDARLDLYWRFVYTGPGSTLNLALPPPYSCGSYCVGLYRLVDYTDNVVVAERVTFGADSIPLTDGHVYGLDVTLDAATFSESHVEFAFNLYGTIVSAVPDLPPAARDFNLDGHSDAILQNGDGIAALYLGGLLGNQILRANWIAQTGAAGWRVAGSGDFNQDGHADLVAQHETSGVAAVLHLGRPQGNVPLLAAELAPTAGWRVVGAGDFNGDGAVDVVLQHPATHAVQLRYLTGPHGTDTLNTLALDTEVPAGWAVVGTGDVNADGAIDLVVQHDETSQVAALFLGGPDGNLVTGANWISEAGVAGWEVVGTGDFNRDGRLDLVWQKEDSLKPVGIWYLGGGDGTGVLGASWISESGLGPWSLSAR